MSVLKNSVIDLPQSEQKTLIRFLLLYALLCIAILSLGVFSYYTSQKELFTKNRTLELNQYANEFLINLKELHNDKTNTLLYPVDLNFKTSLYDKNYKIIYSTLTNPEIQLENISFDDNKIVRYIKNPQEYYINTQYIVVEIMPDTKWINNITKDIILYGIVFFTFMLTIGYFLTNLFLRPLKNVVHILDNFIKDTTHELNTPISTIMTNIELIDKDNIKDKSLLKSINRIDIGAKTISNIYDDLTYLILNHKLIKEDKDINLKILIEQRIEYFETLINIKKINLSIQLEENVILNIDEKKISKLIDNILSNAIKYNKISGNINIVLKTNSLSIKDTGKGIENKNIDKLFNRYSRFDNSIGGFGIGLNIVKLIAEEYSLNIKVNSKVNEGSEFILSW
ncbi:MAG TPA: HAMP domain-containing histidine kinase [Arcobacter sp.]|nr:HAMP domain-containing histidine kinase [Arcobacter sp.]HIP56031.1 HAMP domain-containing histidine kinase [Arcobacter sp.]